MNSPIEQTTNVHFAFSVAQNQPIVPPRFQVFQSLDKVVTEGVPVRRNKSFYTTECSLAFAKRLPDKIRYQRLTNECWERSSATFQSTSRVATSSPLHC